ncbi:MAG: tetratricopeptide repeat protein [Acetobacteraceae bacterium]|nr:tetratricopeptide repeat protein [Acetobacteraceae bacterium]
MSAAHVIHEDDEVRVIHRPGNSDFTLVTFGALTHRPNGMEFWGSEVVRKLGLDAVGFMPKHENWYPAAAMARSAPVVRAVLRPRAVGYGFSMGGYGALKYGRLLGLSHTLAVSPQATIDPRDIPEEPRYHRFFKPELHAGMRIGAADLAAFSVVVADPQHAPDHLHAELVTATGAACRISTPCMGHAAIWILASTEALRGALGFVLAGDAVGLRQFIRARRHVSKFWHSFVGQFVLGRGREAMAERLFERAVQLGLAPAALLSSRAAGLEEQIRWLCRHGRLAEATALATGRAAAAQRNPDAVIRLGQLLLAQESYEGAAALFGRALAMDGRAPAAHLGLVRSLMKLGRRAEALEACRRAVATLPGDPQPALVLAQLLYADGDWSGAEAAYRASAQVAGGDVAAEGTALLGLSHVLVKRGEMREALDVAREAVLRLPGLQPAMDWLALLERRLRAEPMPV